MAIMYCELCERPVEARRRIGTGTWVLTFVSMGLWGLAVPFYRKRCHICGGRAVSKIDPDELSRSPRRTPRAQLERRLDSAVDELDTTTLELDRVRAERDFYRGLTDPDDSETE